MTRFSVAKYDVSSWVGQPLKDEDILIYISYHNEVV